jgi:uncharacterized membrane protein
MPGDAYTKRIIALAVFLAISALLIVLGELLARRRIRPNRYIGIRTPAMMRNPELWYVANAFAGRLLIGVGAVLAILAVALFFVQGIDPDAYVRIKLIALVALAVAYTVATLAYARAVSG